MREDYRQFVEAKAFDDVASGFDPGELGDPLFPFQAAIVRWACRRGRAAIFANTGLGKTAMQVTWADLVSSETGMPVLIVAPLCVAKQTVSEAAKFGHEVEYVRTMPDNPWGLYVTNYEMLDEFSPDQFAGIVLDESSILKNRDGATRKRIIETWRVVPYRLSCTATPSPNDHMELGNQAEFLGIMGMDEMLAMFFTHDGGNTSKWRLKGHGRRKFWEWMATWAVTITSPADLGFDGSAYELPQLRMAEHAVESKYGDGLFGDIAQTLTERREAKKETVTARAMKTAEIVLNSICDEHGWSGGDARAGREQEVHEGVLQEQSREVQENSGAASRTQSQTPRAVCKGQGVPGKNQAAIEGVLVGKAGAKESGQASAKLRHVDGGLRGADGASAGGVRHLRVFGHEQQKHISASGSLPPKREGSRASLPELQSGARQIQRLYVESVGGNGLPDPKQAPEPWIVWCHSNEEQRELEKLLDGLCFSIYGALPTDQKESRLQSWLAGERPVMISKPSVIGMGLNLQHCARMAFVGLDDSFEQMYQAIRRCWRFGQTRPVDVHIVTAESLGAIKANVQRKEEQMEEMQASMVKHMRAFMDAEIKGAAVEKADYTRDVATGDGWTLHLGDCVDVLSEMEPESVGYTVFSPPFASLYTYSNSDFDMGNVKNDGEFMEQFRFLVGELYRVTKPGRLLSFHCMNLPTSKVRDGVIGIKDFRGDLIRMFCELGWIYHSEVVIWKDPVTAMQRTKALGLLHKQIKKDSAMSRQGIPDYLVTMRKPGENQDRISHTSEQFPVELWQQYASPVWMDINPTRTIGYRDAREEDDERHIAPLQLDVIERALDLWSRPGDLVLSPFAGIGSEGYCAVRRGRRFVGAELKRSYWEAAKRNLDAAVKDTVDMFQVGA